MNLFGCELSFSEPDTASFPCLDLAYKAGAAGGTVPACLNAANEIAVAHFLQGELAFTAIPAVVDAVLQKHDPVYRPGIEQIRAADRWARREAQRLIAGITG